MSNYYKEHSQEYINQTIDANMKEQYDFFEKYLKPKAKILDVGFGSARDMLYFKNKGYDVYGFDLEEEFVKHALTLNLNVKQGDILTFKSDIKFDAIWACASLLHLKGEELLKGINNLLSCMSGDGVMYLSFKYGDFEGNIEGRYFTYLNEKKLSKLKLNILEQMITKDKINRDVKWLNLILIKSGEKLADSELLSRKFGRILLYDIQRKVLNNPIFKNDKEDLIKKLIEATNLHIETILQIQGEKYDAILIDNIIAQFRHIIKFIYMSKSEEMTDVISTCNLSDMCELIKYFMHQYTPVRIYLENCIIGNRIIEKIDETSYFEPNYNGIDDYIRMRPKVTENYVTKDAFECFVNTQKYMHLKKISIKDINKLYKDIFFISKYNHCIEISKEESEIDFDCNFGDFTYNNLLEFCASLKLLSMINISVIKKDYLINFIFNFTKIKKETIELLLNYFTYNLDYQKNKITLLQPLFLIDDKYYFYPFTLLIGQQPLKLYRVIKDNSHKKYENSTTKIAKNKEKQMLDMIVVLLGKYNLKIQKNYQLKTKDRISAEYDLLIYDEDVETLYVIECKWHFVADGEFEHDVLKNILKKEVLNRIKQNKFLENSLSTIMKEKFDEKPVKKVVPLLISQNHFIREDFGIKVIDFETLRLAVSENDTFIEVIEYIMSDKYLDNIPLGNKRFSIKLEDYSFEIFGAFSKNKV